MIIRRLWRQRIAIAAVCAVATVGTAIPGAVADDNVTTLDESATERTAAKPGWITNKSPMKDLSAGTWAEFVGPTQDPGVRPERCSLPPDLNLAAMDSSSSTTQMSGRVFPIG